MLHRSIRDGKAGIGIGAPAVVGIAIAAKSAIESATGLALGTADAYSPTSDGIRPKCWG